MNYNNAYQIIMSIPNIPQCILQKIWVYFLSFGTPIVFNSRQELNIVRYIPPTHITINSVHKFKLYLNRRPIIDECMLDLKLAYLENNADQDQIQFAICLRNKLARSRLLKLDYYLFTHKTPTSNIIYNEILRIFNISQSDYDDDCEDKYNVTTILKHNIILNSQIPPIYLPFY
jgi:hypothetical protein